MTQNRILTEIYSAQIFVFITSDDVFIALFFFQGAIFECLLDVEGRSVRVPASMTDSSVVQCDETVYYYDAEKDEVGAIDRQM